MMFSIAQDFASVAAKIASETELSDALAQSVESIGFRYFMLTNHVALLEKREAALRVSNYPEPWVSFIEESHLGPVDPVLRASLRTSAGFAWSRLSDLIVVTSRDQQLLSLAVREGIGDGFTVPGHVPGEVAGSCSFATKAGVDAPAQAFPIAQWIGGLAFESARRLRLKAGHRPLPRLTDRQRDCLVWAARGKTDWEIAAILGIRPDTVIQHLKQARERYGVHKRALLAVRALFDGTISFAEILRR